MPTRPSYRRECGYALDDLGLHTSSSSTTGTLVFPALVNGTTGASTLTYDDRYLFLPASGEQLRVRPGGYAPSTGTLTHYPASSNPGAVVAEFTSLFPVAAAPGEATTYHSLINQALSLIDVEDTLSVSITSNADHSLATWVHWIADERIRRRPDGTLDVRESRGANTAPIAVPGRGWEYVADANTPKLRARVPFAVTSGTLEVHVLRPADTWIAVGGTFAESTAGLTAESDQALPPVRDVVRVFLLLAYRALLNRQPGAPSDPQIMKKFLDARDDAQSVRGFNAARAASAMAEPARAA